jgi:hypothetical protein
MFNSTENVEEPSKDSGENALFTRVFSTLSRKFDQRVWLSQTSEQKATSPDRLIKGRTFRKSWVKHELSKARPNAAFPKALCKEKPFPKVWSKAGFQKVLDQTKSAP